MNLPCGLARRNPHGRKIHLPPQSTYHLTNLTFFLRIDCILHVAKWFSTWKHTRHWNLTTVTQKWACNFFEFFAEKSDFQKYPSDLGTLWASLSRWSFFWPCSGLGRLFQATLSRDMCKTCSFTHVSRKRCLKEATKARTRPKKNSTDLGMLRASLSSHEQ